MTLDTLIMLGGAFVAILPFLGFPNSWDKALLLIVGTLIIVLGIIVRRRLGGRVSYQENRRDTFVESTPRFGGGHEEV